MHPLYYENNISAVTLELYPLHSYSQHLMANCASPCFALARKHQVISLQASTLVLETTAQWQSIPGCAAPASGVTRATESHRDLFSSLKPPKISNNQAEINGALQL